MFEVFSWSERLPPVELEVYESHLDLFFETMYERMMIWKRRFIEQRPRPWTDNKIFQESKFTNVYRELDRNSQWQIKNILLDDKLTLFDLVWKMMVFRTFNNPETFEQGRDEMGWRNGIPSWSDYNKEEFTEFIGRIRRNGRNPYTTAYLINSNATPGYNRDYCYTQVVIPTLHKKIPQLFSVVKNAEKPEEIINFLKTLPAVADFIAHEYYQDFTYIPRYTDKTFMKFNQNDFTNVGPGASVGIRLIYPSLTSKEQKSGIYKLRDEANARLTAIGQKKGEPMQYLTWDKNERRYILIEECNITLHQIEMWLCEFQKYWKMIIGEGKQRSKFVPRTEKIIVEK